MKMDKSYFEEKINASCECLEIASKYLQESIELIQNSHYDLPNLVDSKEVHDGLKLAIAGVLEAAIDFEKARWASTSTGLEFEEWVSKQNLEYIKLLQTRS